MSYKVRSLHADEWPRAKALRLEALRDPVASIAFMETYESAAAESDSFWQGRAERSAEGASGAQQIIAEGPDGEWVGTVTVLMEEAGSTDWAGLPVERLQGHLVGVYVQPGHRGSGSPRCCSTPGSSGRGRRAPSGCGCWCTRTTRGRCGPTARPGSPRPG